VIDISDDINLVTLCSINSLADANQVCDFVLSELCCSLLSVMKLAMRKHFN